MTLEPADAKCTPPKAALNYHADFETRHYETRNVSDSKKLYRCIKLIHKDQVRVSWLFFGTHIVRVFGEKSRLDAIELAGRQLIRQKTDRLDWFDSFDLLYMGAVLLFFTLVCALVFMVGQNGAFIVQCPQALADTCGGCMDQCKSICQ